MKHVKLSRGLLLAAAALLPAAEAQAACCYFSAQNADILQPAQKVFITWDPVKQIESFTVQPKFEGNALDFGMVVPTPSRPTLHEMPRDFFKHLAVYSILKGREFPDSKLLRQWRHEMFGECEEEEEEETAAAPRPVRRKRTVAVLEAGVVGSLDYKVIAADRADDLLQWLKDNKYHYSGDEATLNFYVQKKWLFTVMKIDTMQMKKNKDGSFAGEVTPTRFQFSSDKPVYPLKITQISVKDKTEALFYVQAPFKVDLPGDMSYRFTWLPMLQSASGCTPGGLPGRGGAWLEAINVNIPAILQRGERLGFEFTAGQRPRPNHLGHVPTTMEWARRLSADDVRILRGQGSYSERVPNFDEGFSDADLKDPVRGHTVRRLIQARLERSQQARPIGYRVREAPSDDVKNLRHLAGHLQVGQFITKFRKVFARNEMNDDLVLVRAREGGHDDFSEYEEILPSSPP